MNYAFGVSKTTTEVIGTWSGDGGKPQDTTKVDYVYVTIDQFTQVSTTGLTFPSGQFRWKYIGGSLIEQVDTRPRLKFTPTSALAEINSSGRITINVVTVDASGTPITTYTGTLYFSYNQEVLQIIITNGVGTFDITKKVPRNLVIKSCASFDVYEPLTVKIYQIVL
jgi:hypothetical protein